MNKRNANKRRITGRFYALLCMALVLLVALGVLISQRIKSAPPDLPVAVVQTPAPKPIETPDPVEEIEAEGEGEPTLPPISEEQRVRIQDLEARTNLPAEWKNILLLGSDSRDMKKLDRTDTIIIASINTQDGRIKLTSVMRDTIVTIPGHGEQKINACTHYGDVNLLIRTLNVNLGLNITEYAMVNFEGMARVVDILNGVYINITEPERDIINKHMGEIAKYTMDQQEYLANRSKLELKTYGPDTLLSGIQAVTFARIREIGDDYQRTDRQKEILTAIANRAMGANAVQITQLATGIWDYVDTNVNMWGAIGLAQAVLKDGIRVEEGRVPTGKTAKSEVRGGVDAFWDVDFEEQTRYIHEFIYGNAFP